MRNLRKKRILMLCTRHKYSDGRVMEYISKPLRDQGYDVTMICPKFDDEADQFEVEGIHVITYKKQHKLPAPIRKLHTLRRIMAEAVREKYDVYHAHEPDASLIAALYAKRSWARRGHHAKVVFDAHEATSHYYSCQLSQPFLQRVAYHMAVEWEHLALHGGIDGVITAHEFEKGYYQLMRPEIPVSAVLNTPPVDLWGEPRKRSGPICTIGHEGFFTLKRRSDLMLQAFEQIAGDDPNLSFLIAGDARYHDPDRIWFNDWIEKSGLQNRVVAPHWVERASLPDYLDRMDIGILFIPDGEMVNRVFPVNKLMNYLARNVPVVAYTRSQATRRFIIENECGVVIDHPSAGALAAALRSMVDNPESTRRMGERGYELVVEHFHPQDARDNLQSFYRTLLSSDRPGVKWDSK